MTHMKPVSETEGTFGLPGSDRYECRKCGKKEVTCEEWESSCGGYVDEKYTCGACGNVYWIDGPDS